MKVLVTGASGFVGGAVVRDLRDDHEVVAVSRSGAPVDGVADVRADLTDAQSLAAVEGCEVVVHCAASMNAASRDVLWAANVVATRNLLEWAATRGARRFIYVSTGSVYGYGAGHFARETDPLDPIGDYGHTKYLGEELCRYYAQCAGLELVVLRLYFPYGPGQTRGMFHLIRNAVRQDAELTLNAGGAPRVTPIHISDVAAAIRRCLPAEARPGVYNLCGAEAVSFGEAVQMIESLLGKRARIRQTSNASGDLLGDGSLLQEVLQWSPAMRLRESLDYLLDETD